MKRMLLVSLSVATMAAVVVVDEARSSAQGQGQGLALGRPEVTPAVYHDVSRPLRDMPSMPMVSTRPDFEVKRPAGPEQGAPDSVVQSVAAAPLAATTGTSFEGIGDGAYGFNVRYAPPDTTADVGPSHYVQWVNVSFAVFTKSTGQIVSGFPKAGNTPWSGFGGGCQNNNDGDPIVQYDQLADRWVLTQFSVSTTPYLQCVAVSTSPDPTGSYYRYAFSYSDFPDYPKMGVWPDAYYITFNMFRNGAVFSGNRVCAYDRARMLQGLSATQQCFQTSSSLHSLLPADLEGSILPPAGAPNYLLNRGGSSTINLWKFHVDWANPANTTFTGPTAISVASYSTACNGGTCIPQAGTSNQLDSLGDRLMYRLSYRNLNSGADPERLVVNHSVAAGSSTGIRWYEVGIAGGTPKILQQGTYAPDSLYRWMGSMATDKMGNIAVGFSVSSSGMNPALRFAGREVNSGQALGVLSAETSLWSGTGSQTGTLHRWGDYSTISVDPADDCTFWYTTEYVPANGSFNWRTRVHSFKFSSCGGSTTPDFSLSVSPASQTVTQGGSASFSVTSTPSGGFSSDVDLSVSGLPTGAAATFSIDPISGGSGTSQMDVTTASTTPAGTYTLTITGTGGTSTHTATATLVVNPPVAPDFTISASPGSRSIRRGQSTTYTVSTTAVGGFSGSIGLNVTGLPSGTTTQFSQNPVTAGGSATLTITASSSAAKGTYVLTIAGTSGTLSHSTTVSLRIR